MANLKLKIENKIAILEFDQPDSKVNVLNSGTMREFSRIIEELAHKSGEDVQALIITSKKDGVFIAGADIKEIERISSGEEAFDAAEKGKQILNGLYNLNLITVAAINGVCLGGGLELALACKYRVAGFNDKVKIGLPEVKLGLIPGWGGTQRLPRLIGLTRALKMILSGQTISGKEALKYGLVDRLFPETRLIDQSLDFVRRLFVQGEASHNRGKKGTLLFFESRSKTKNRSVPFFLENTLWGRAILYRQAKKNVLRKTKGFYPAPLKALEVIRAAYGKDIRKGFFIESEAFGELAVTEVSKNLIKVFYLNEEFKKLPWVDTGIKPAPINKCAVVGAGVMGGGIAQLLTCRDLPVRVKDINYDALKAALKTARGIFDYALNKKKLKKHQVDYKLGLISPTLTYRGFENTDLVIEAVVEDINIKQKVFRDLSQIASTRTIFASNTSALPIIKLAEAVDLPQRVVGLHFFNPVHRMPLVEIIKSSQTSDQTLATVIAFARRIGKMVIVVQDVAGFLINRILLPYLNEAANLVAEGMSIERIDRIARKFGMPVGPLELVDRIGIEVGYKVARILEDAYGERMRVAPILKKIAHRSLQSKKKHGFYIHKGKKKTPNRDIYNTIPHPRGVEVSDQGALKRMIYIMVNEAARCLEEKVVDSPRAVDIGMIMGTGFPLFRGGLLRYADSVGIENIVRDLQSFDVGTGRTLTGTGDLSGIERFKPCGYLREMVEKREGFYKCRDRACPCP